MTYCSWVHSIRAQHVVTTRVLWTHVVNHSSLIFSINTNLTAEAMCYMDRQNICQSKNILFMLVFTILTSYLLNLIKATGLIVQISFSVEQKPKKKLSH